MTGIVYIIRNNVNGKEYVGQTIGNMRKRYLNHCYSKVGIFSQAIRKHGRDSFGYITNDVPVELMDCFESNLIEFFSTISPGGYNLETGGHANKRLSSDTKKKISEANSGDKNHNWGKHFSQQWRKRMSESRMGCVYSEETRKRMSMARIGKHNSEEARANISKGLMGHVVSEITKKKISEARSKRKMERITNV